MAGACVVFGFGRRDVGTMIRAPQACGCVGFPAVRRGLVLAALVLSLTAGWQGMARAQQIDCPVATAVDVADGSFNATNCTIVTTGQLSIGAGVSFANDGNLGDSGVAFLAVNAPLLNSGVFNNLGGMVIGGPGSIMNGASGVANVAVVNDSADGSVLSAGRITNQNGATWTNSGGAGLFNDGVFTVQSGARLNNTGAGT